MIEWITLMVFTLPLGALVKYTRDTTKRREIEEQRRVVEHDPLIRQYDLHLEFLDFEDQQGKLYLRNVGGPVRDVKIEPNVKVLRQQRQERWYPTISYSNIALSHPSNRDRLVILLVRPFIQIWIRPC